MTVRRPQSILAAVAAVAVALPVSLALSAPPAGAAAPPRSFGPACSSLPSSGSGSAAGMAKDKVATAAAHNPQLATLTAAIKRAGLTDTLNNAQNITVFAPTNDAFKKVPKADLVKLLANKTELKKVLTYHVVGQKITQSQLANGSFTTLEGGKLTTSGSGSNFTVNNTAKIVCGDVTTGNATVNLIDTVLMPPGM